MQTPMSRPGYLDVPQKPSLSTPRIARKLKPPGSDSDSVPSPNTISKTPKDRSPKVVDRRSPRNLATDQKKKPTKVSELETQVSHLQDELKKTKDQLSSSESLRRRVELDAEETKKQLIAMSAKFEDTQKQLEELSESEDTRIQELRKISQDRDRAWQSELEAVQKQHSIESSAYASAMNEIQKLKIQLDRVSQSEFSHARHAESAHAEIQCLRVELTETLDLVEKLKEQLNNSRENEAQAHEANSGNADAMKSYDSLLLELEESKKRVNLLEELVGEMSAQPSGEVKTNGECEESDILKTEINNLKNEVSHLRGELEAAERSYRDEYIQSTLEIRNAYELVERAKLESRKREAELEAKINESKDEINELRTKLIEKENALQNRGLILKSEDEIELDDLKARLLDKESQLQSVKEENETLKSEIKKKEIEIRKVNDEALSKLRCLTEKADNSSRKAERVIEQLDATQASNSEMEAELRRLKVQSDQWRKAAEAAAAMLSTVNNGNGKVVERTGSMDLTIGRKLSSEILEDSDDDSPKKRNGNMLKKIGVLLKKGQK
ncbi:hypothetical protein DH2020_049890 [Rehmannia glutinosa]|uniref:Interactor of constitutive active ROPs 2, chloroplastic-like n=1 Tax=Rehmannia glutinosa TaxID=99300 RepID=A0ABR0U1R2_REHGL